MLILIVKLEHLYYFGTNLDQANYDYFTFITLIANDYQNKVTHLVINALWFQNDYNYHHNPTTNNQNVHNNTLTGSNFSSSNKKLTIVNKNLDKR